MTEGERVKKDIYFGFSLPQSRFARQLPRQREPNYATTIEREPIAIVGSGIPLCFYPIPKDFLPPLSLSGLPPIPPVEPYEVDTELISTAKLLSPPVTLPDAV